jgi:hypothetical protein
MAERWTTHDDAVVRDLRELIGKLTDDEGALMCTLTPSGPPEAATVEHLFDLVDLLATIRHDDAMADYVYAIAPGWDGSIETLVFGGLVTTAINRHELESYGADLAVNERAASVRRPRARRVPASVG